MNKKQVVDQILAGRNLAPGEPGTVYAPANIALCKYWGKRNEELNLPVTDSLSISLGIRGAHTQIAASNQDALVVNGDSVNADAPMAVRLFKYLDLFRPEPGFGFQVDTESTIPIGAGLASSASGFASMVMAMDRLFGWELGVREQSILARLGSGSACRSIQPGFVWWQAGEREDGMDSFGERLDQPWKALRVGLVTLSEGEKPISSREAMKRTSVESALYRSWPAQVAQDLAEIKAGIASQDFSRLGRAAEANALSMHATMWGCRPPIIYWLPASLETINRVHRLREEGLEIYLTMDAGPNVKLLLLESQADEVTRQFPGISIEDPWMD